MPPGGWYGVPKPKECPHPEPVLETEITILSELWMRGVTVTDGNRYSVCHAVRGGSGERWDRAERNLFQGLDQLGMVDVFRALNGDEVEQSCW